jgi:integrase
MLGVANDEERFLVQFLLTTGMREQEAAHTEWDDVTWERTVIRVAAKPHCRCSYCGPQS